MFDSELNPSTDTGETTKRRRPSDASTAIDAKTSRVSSVLTETPADAEPATVDEEADTKPVPKKSPRRPVRDEFQLRRYTSSQKTVFDRALREIKAGSKNSCWMWFVIPTPPYIVDGVEMGSGTNRKYALRSDEEVRAFLSFEADGVHLGRNYLEMIVAMRDQLRKGVKPVKLVGVLDEPKLRSSVRLFERVTRDSSLGNSLSIELHEVLVDVLKSLKEDPDP